jgi:DNA repair exonuclease SbcCD ATPase subunit
VPDQLTSSAAALCAALRSMVEEETAELMQDTSEEVLETAAGKLAYGHFDALMKLAAESPALELARPKLDKAGARHSKADQERIQKAHDHLVEAGAACGAGKAANIEEVQKAASELEVARNDLSKIAAERDALRKTLDGLSPQLDEILKRVKNIEQQPVGMPQLRVVEKAQDDAAAAASGLHKMLDDPGTAEALATLAIRMAQRNGQSFVAR